MRLRITKTILGMRLLQQLVIKIALKNKLRRTFICELLDLHYELVPDNSVDLTGIVVVVRARFWHKNQRGTK